MASFFYFFQHFLLCNNSRHELCSGFGPFYTQKNNYGRRPMLVSAAEKLCVGKSEANYRKKMKTAACTAVHCTGSKKV